MLPVPEPRKLCWNYHYIHQICCTVQILPQMIGDSAGGWASEARQAVSAACQPAVPQVGPAMVAAAIEEKPTLQNRFCKILQAVQSTAQLILKRMATSCMIAAAVLQFSAVSFRSPRFQPMFNPPACTATLSILIKDDMSVSTLIATPEGIFRVGLVTPLSVHWERLANSPPIEVLLKEKLVELRRSALENNYLLKHPKGQRAGFGAPPDFSAGERHARATERRSPPHMSVCTPTPPNYPTCSTLAQQGGRWPRIIGSACPRCCRRTLC
eukprot:6214375-Pleurochrysis_carterae.AAC.2